MQGKKLKPQLDSSDDLGEVSDEDEAAEVTTEQPKEKKSHGKVKLDPSFSDCVGMKALSFKGVAETLNASKCCRLLFISEDTFHKNLNTTHKFDTKSNFQSKTMCTVSFLLISKSNVDCNIKFQLDRNILLQTQLET